ncbi:MAG: hypothetical protein ACYDDF_01440 [Thermoplasmatota archaeon]
MRGWVVGLCGAVVLFAGCATNAPAAVAKGLTFHDTFHVDLPIGENRTFVSFSLSAPASLLWSIESTNTQFFSDWIFPIRDEHAFANDSNPRSFSIHGDTAVTNVGSATLAGLPPGTYLLGFDDCNAPCDWIVQLGITTSNS